MASASPSSAALPSNEKYGNENSEKTSNVMLAIEVQSRAKEISRICGS